jgi:2-iminobutanoate/2-iminopropanoate deaminase
MEKEIITIPGAKRRTLPDGRHEAPLSPGVRAGDFVFVSGQTPSEPATGEFVQGDIQVQTRQVLENVKAVLEAGGSSLDKVVKSTVYCANAGHFRAVNEVYREYFPEDPPARTFVTVGSWPGSFDIEIECIAIG